LESRGIKIFYHNSCIVSTGINITETLLTHSIAAERHFRVLEIWLGKPKKAAP
jgi:hypothetical protein